MNEKPKIEADVRFEVLVNGELATISGVAGKSRLHMVLGWNSREVPEVSMLLHGFERPSNDLVTWEMPDVKPGDEITIRIPGPGPCNDGDHLGGVPGDG
jgi:hypothetical protein